MSTLSNSHRRESADVYFPDDDRAQEVRPRNLAQFLHNFVDDELELWSVSS